MGSFSSSSEDSEEFQPERNCLILDDPSTEIMAYSRARVYWQLSRYVMNTPVVIPGARRFYVRHCPEMVQKCVQSIVRLNVPDWLINRKSIRERCPVGLFPDLVLDDLMDLLAESAQIFDATALNCQLSDTKGTVSEGCSAYTLPLSVVRSLDLCHKAQKRVSITSFSNRTWTHIYDTFLESAWIDELESRGLQLEFVPEWGVHENQCELEEYKFNPEYECLKVVPDAVLYAYVDWMPEQAGLTSEQTSSLSRHLEHALADLTVDFVIPSYQPWQRENFKQLKIPLIVVEYVKAPSEYKYTREPHISHARMAMMSVVGLHKTLGISHLPVFGLLVERNLVQLLVRWADSSEMNHISEVPTEGASFDITNPFEALRLRLLLSKLCKHAETVQQCAKEAQAKLVLDVLQDKWFHWRLTEFPDLQPSPVDASSIDEWRQTV